MTDDTDDLAALLDQAATALRQRPAQRNWIAQFRDGAALTASEAAKVAAKDVKTIHRWCEAREIEHPDRPLGYSVGKLWLVDAAELLHEIETRYDLHARRVAESRLKQLQEERARSPQTLRAAEHATG